MVIKSGGIKLKRIIPIFIFLLVFSSFGLAIRGEIGSGRVVINDVWEGEKTIERTILIRNINDVPIDITLLPTEDIEDIIHLIDGEFTLEAGEERKARFDIVLDRPGEWDGRIHVYFKPEDGNTVVLASHMIIKSGAAEGVEIPEEIPDETPDGDEEIEDDEDEIEEDDNEITGDVAFGMGGTDSPKPKKDFSGIIILVILLVVIVAAVGGGIYFLRK